MTSERLDSQNRESWIPFKLTENHKCQRMGTCQSIKKANIFDSILTGDEKWIAIDNTHQGKQWLDSDQVPLGTPKPHKFVKKVMLCVWWNTQGIVRHEVLEIGEMVNSNLGRTVLPHAPYSLDLAASGYHLFRSMGLGFAICSSPTSNILENGSVTFLPSSSQRFTIQESETYEKDARCIREIAWIGKYYIDQTLFNFQ